jgi:hypothetical protein
MFIKILFGLYVYMIIIMIVTHQYEKMNSYQEYRGFSKMMTTTIQQQPTTKRYGIHDQIHYDDLSLKKCKNSIDWSIHGWWPEYSKGKWPQFCDKNRYHEFNVTAISPIQDKLNKYWYSCPEWNIKAYALWQHEWQKHGTCISNVSVIDYFNHTINALLKAQSSNYYECCSGGNNSIECLIPFAMPLNETKWLGYCYNSCSSADF